MLERWPCQVTQALVGQGQSFTFNIKRNEEPWNGFRESASSRGYLDAPILPTALTASEYP